jgi:hypothetical protein
MDTNKIQIIKIEGTTTDVFLDYKGTGKGKITISDTDWGYNFSHYWGAMGCELDKFLMEISPSYFAGKLSSESYVMDIKKTMVTVRRAIKEELPWYRYVSAQKELREELNGIQSSVETKEGFVNAMNDLVENIICFDLDLDDRREFKKVLSGIVQEPWYFIQETPSKQYRWLESLLPKIQKYLKK